MSSEFDELLDACIDAVEAALDEAGEAAVEYNKANGDYHNITGRLRRSNTYRIERAGRMPSALIIGNDADYAADVEAKGRMVVTGGTLLAHKKLTE